MIPFILAAIGGYLIGDSVGEDLKFAQGGELDDKKIRRYRNRIVDLNIGKNLPALDFAIALIDFILDKRLLVSTEELPIDKTTDTYKQVLRFRNKLVQFNVFKDEPALDFAIGLTDLYLDGHLAKNPKFSEGGKINPDKLPFKKPNPKDVVPKGYVRIKNPHNMTKEELHNLLSIIDENDDKKSSKMLKKIEVKSKYAKGGSVGVDKASNGFKKKFVWIKEQNGFASEILQQKTFEEDFEEISNGSRFKLIRDDKGLKVFTDDKGWRIAFHLKPIFAYGGQLELDFEPEEEIDESTLKARRYVELQNLANEQIQLFGEIEDETAKEIEDLGDSLNSHEVELVMEMYGKKKFAKGGVLDRKMYVVEIYSIETDDNGDADDDMDLEKYTLRVAATDNRDAIDSAESLFVEEYGALPIFDAKVVKSFDLGGSIDDSGDLKLSHFNPNIHDEEVKLVSLGSGHADIEFNIMFADNAMVTYLLEYELYRSDYNWFLDKVYKIKDGKKVEEYLHWNPEFRAIENNKFISESVENIIGEAIQDDYDESSMDDDS
jgi:hypothetical protein